MYIFLHVIYYYFSIILKCKFKINNSIIIHKVALFFSKYCSLSNIFIFQISAFLRGLLKILLFCSNTLSLNEINLLGFLL